MCNYCMQGCIFISKIRHFCFKGFDGAWLWYKYMDSKKIWTIRFKRLCICFQAGWSEKSHHWPSGYNTTRITVNTFCTLIHFIENIGKVKVNFSFYSTPIIPDCHPFKVNPLIIGEDGRPHSCFRQYKSYNALQCERFGFTQTWLIFQLIIHNIFINNFWQIE